MINTFANQTKSAKALKTNSNSSFQRSNSISRTSTVNYPGDYAQKVKLMEKYISIVKENALDKNRKALIEKHRKKQELKNNIDILSTYVKLNRVNNRNFAVLTKEIQKGICFGSFYLCKNFLPKDLIFEELQIGD